MLGLMQNWPLTVDKILDHAARWHGDVEMCRGLVRILMPALPARHQIV